MEKQIWRALTHMQTHTYTIVLVYKGYMKAYCNIIFMSITFQMLSRVTLHKFYHLYLCSTGDKALREI